MLGEANTEQLMCVLIAEQLGVSRQVFSTESALVATKTWLEWGGVLRHPGALTCLSGRK